MNKYLLFEAMGEISDRHLEPVLAKLEPSAGRTKTPGRILRLILIAAALLTLLAATAVAAEHFWGLSSRLIPTTISFTFSDETIDREALVLNGVPDSPEYQAAAEWLAFTASHRYPEEIFATSSNAYAYDFVHAGDDEQLRKICDTYDAFDREAMDTLLGIRDKYGLQLLTESTSLSRWQFTKVPALKQCFPNPQNLQGYFWEDGSFRTEGSIPMDFAEYPVGFSLVRVKAGCLYPYSYYSFEPFEEWQYTTADGCIVSLAISDSHTVGTGVPDITNALLLYNAEDSFLTASVRWHTEDAIAGSARKTAEFLAEQFDWAGLTAADTSALFKEFPHPDRSRDAAALLEDFLQSGEYRANREFAEYCVANMKPDESPHYIGIWENKYESIAGHTGSFTGVYGSTGVEETDAAIQAIAEEYDLAYPTYTEMLSGFGGCNTYHTFWGFDYYDTQGTFIPLTVDEVYTRLGQSSFSGIPLDDIPTSIMINLYDTGAFVAYYQNPVFALHYIPKGTFYTLLYNFAEAPEAYSRVWEYETACGETVVCAMTEGSKTPAPMVLYDTGAAWVVITADANAASLEATADVLDFTKLA